MLALLAPHSGSRLGQQGRSGLLAPWPHGTLGLQASRSFPRKRRFRILICWSSRSMRMMPSSPSILRRTPVASRSSPRITFTWRQQPVSGPAAACHPLRCPPKGPISTLLFLVGVMGSRCSLEMLTTFSLSFRYTEHMPPCKRKDSRPAQPACSQCSSERPQAPQAGCGCGLRHEGEQLRR